MKYLNYNGTIIRSDKQIIKADNRSFRYGDGVFETIRMINGAIPLADLHFQRLMHGVSLLQFNWPSYLTASYFLKQIHQLAEKNSLKDKVRVRLMIFRGEGGLYDTSDAVNYIIQSWSLPDEPARLNENGLLIDVFPDARIACDKFANLKSNNYLPYLMGAMFVKKQQLNDCVLLNTRDNICDATIANVFIVKAGRIVTPALSEGCVAGVMRQFLINSLSVTGEPVIESIITETDLHEAEEVFLTNAIYGIRWVKQFQGISYRNELTAGLYNRFIRNIF